MDLRKFINKLEKEGELIRVYREVNRKFEAAALINKLSKEKNKAVILEKIKNHHIPIASQILGSYDRLASYMGLDKKSIIAELSKRWGQKKVHLYSFHTTPFPLCSSRKIPAVYP